MSVLSLPIEPQTAKNGDMYYNSVEQKYYSFKDGEWVEQVDTENATSIVQEVVVEDNYLKNTATGSDGLTIAGTASTVNYATNVGTLSQATSTNTAAFGRYARATNGGASAVGASANASGAYSVALGSNAAARAAGAIMLGGGSNSEEKTFKVALRKTSTQATDEASGLYTLLNADGKVPVGRYIAMTGADGTNAGTIGAVPAPSATDNTKFLRGDGTWAEAGSNVSYDSSTQEITLG